MMSDEDTVDEIVDAFMNSANPRIRRFIRSMVRAELRGVDPSWVDQHLSVLGPRKHIEAVRRRLSADPPELGARHDKKARRYLLSQEAIAEELGRLSAPGVRKTRAENDLDEEGAEVLAQLDRDLARVGR